MNSRDIIFLLSGLGIALIITYFLLIKKFNKFINEEISKNEYFRKNAEADFVKSRSNQTERNDLEDEEENE